MSKRGLPSSVQMRHDSHYVDVLATATRTIGKTIPVHLIAPNPEQPRREIGDLTELSNSIREKGVLEPLLVKPDYKNGTWMIIAGERRWRAANLAGLREVPCIELDIDEQSIAEIALIENLQRKDLTVWEEADGLAALNEKFGYTHEEISKKIGRSRTTVTELMAVASLSQNIRERCRQSNLTAKSILLEIARQFDETAMNEFLDKITNQNLNREKIRLTARPQKSKVDNLYKSKINAAIPTSNPVSSGNIFQYKSINDEFVLKLEFIKLSQLDKGSVLKALKETFEKIKKDGLD